MFKFIKQIFISTMMYFSNLSSVNLLECISMKNQEFKVRPEIADINSNNPIFYPFSIKINKCSGNCNNVNDPYARICVPDVVKNLNVKVSNLMSRNNETRHIKWHETWKCICRLDKIICKNKQRWNKDKFRCECKELIDKAVCDKGYVWNPGNCECGCDKSCSIGEYLNYSYCKCRKKLVDPLVEECTKTIEEVKLVNITIENENSYYKCSSYNVYIAYIVLFPVILAIIIGISIYFVYYRCYLKEYSTHSVFSIRKETMIY